MTIYFAGHGSPDSPDSKDNLYLLPYDTQYDDIATSAFPMGYKNSSSKTYKSKKVIVLADACHGGGVGSSFDIARRANRT